MPLLLELNDLGVRCYQDGQLLCQSPGVAVVDHQELLFGSKAWRESRKQPLNTHSQFWSQLNTDPLQLNHPKVRHHGDLAYLHLLHIEKQLPVDFANQEVVFSLPGSIPRESLGLLLGIANQCGMKTIGLIDHGLAATLSHAFPLLAEQQALTHVEMFLHHCVITELTPANNSSDAAITKLQRNRLEVLSDQGWLSLHNQLLNYFSELFIQQTRFNPRHGASSEQALFDAIPEWLRQCAVLEQESVTSLQCELDRYSIQVDIYQIRQFVQRFWKPLQTKLENAGNLFLGDRLAECMPLLDLPPQTTVLATQRLAKDLTQIGDNLSESPEGVRFITSLPCQNARQNQPETVTSTTAHTRHFPDQEAATHLLWQNHAYPLHGHFTLTSNREMLKEDQDSAVLSIQHGRIHTSQGQLRLNGEASATPLDLTTEPLKSGDRLGISDFDIELTLIRVED
ncbi:hypothetical protein KOI40_09985 [Aestuariicella sp. G3-2]|uniref:hypothetical protein n=1 Tax=Pseudomaricurvus albidus TaxID=2842452 RepID=UPI001C0C4473|nr:hypothetical protein [Aestuariicella albida]MBU3070150.1 hypothetical protein [Aestuariicella albida]